MKKIILALTLFIALTSTAQHLESKIPGNAKAVVSIDGNYIFDLISMDEINELSFVKKALSRKELSSMADMGFDLNSKAYYFYQTMDSVQYNTLLIKLTNKDQFKSLLNNRDKEKIERHLGYEFLFERSMVTAWNDNVLLLSFANFPRRPYDYSYNIYEEPSIIIEEIEEMEEVEEVEEMIIESAEPESGNHRMAAPEPVVEEAPEPVEEIIEIEEVEEVERPIKETKPKYSSVQKVEESLDNVPSTAWARKQAKLKEQREKLMYFALTILREKPKRSITQNNSYVKGKKKGAVGYLWVNSYSKIINDIMQAEMGPYSPYAGLTGSDISYGIDGIQSNLFFTKNEIKLSSNFMVNDAWVSSFKKMYNSSLDKGFYKYIDSNEALAYFSFAMNTEAFLKEYPAMMGQMYGAILPKFKEETQIVSDLVSIMLDEKAIGELITGDMFFVLNDIGEKEVTYTTYSYDEDYNRKEITKTKMEMLPDFTLMLGSENQSIINRIMKLAVKHKLAENSLGYYAFNKKMTDAPFDMYFTTKDDIAFLTNSKEQIVKIRKGGTTNKLGNHKNLLKKNMMAVYMDAKGIMQRIPESYLSKKERKSFQLLEKSFDEVIITSSRVKGNVFSSEQIIKMNGNADNSLQLLLDMIREISK